MGYQIVVYNFARLQADEIAKIFPDKKLNEMDLIDYFEDNLKLVINMEIEKLKNMGVNIISNTDETIIILKPTFEIDTTSLSKAFYHIKDCDVNGSLIIKQDITENKKYQAGKKKRLLWLINELKSRNIHCKGNTKWNNDILLYSCPLCNKDNEKMYMFVNSFHSGTQSKTDCIDQKHQDYFKDLQKELLKKWKEEQNPDFIPVRWDENYVKITFHDKMAEKKRTITLKEFNELDEEYEIIKFNILDVQENTKQLLKHYNIDLKYNIIKRRIEIYENDKRINKSLDNYLVTIRDNGIKHSYRPAKEKIEGDLISIAYSNYYNPIEEYLLDCHAKYLQNPTDKGFKDILNTVTTSEHDKEWYLYHSFLQMVYMGCRHEYNEIKPISGQFLPVFQGGQGEGKTRWFESLLPNHLRHDYFQSLLVLDVGNKDHLIEISSNWLVEIGEIAATFRKSDQEALKSYITNGKDRVRLPYAKEAIDIKRRTCFCGTTNDVEYLRDLTGTRRFLTMGSATLNPDHNVDIDLMWGYFYDLYLKNTRYWHEKADRERVENNNKMYISKPEKILYLEENLNLFPNEDEGKYYSVKEIYNLLPDNIFFPSHIALGKTLKKYNVKTIYNKKRKTNEYFVKYLGEIIENTL